MENDDHDSGEHTEMGAKTKRKHSQPIPKVIMPKTPKPETRGHVVRYPDCNLWAKSFYSEMDKVDENGTVKCLKLVKLGIIQKGAKVINMSFSFNYKCNRDGSI